MKHISRILLFLAFTALSAESMAMEKAPKQTTQLTWSPAQENQLQEAFYLLNSQYRAAQQCRAYLPGYFYQELEKYYNQVPQDQLRLKGKFGNLKIVTKMLKAPQNKPKTNESLSTDEIFDEVSL
ncbi:MAG: hypothetical protein AB7F19_05580 [Candidatus Babeliales bacterium]